MNPEAIRVKLLERVPVFFIHQDGLRPVLMSKENRQVYNHDCVDSCANLLAAPAALPEEDHGSRIAV